jgi:hypothetical protein
MASHAILITYMDMEKKLPEFITKASEKYGRRFKRLYFDAGFQLNLSLDDAVRKISDNDKLKIFISGEGDTGIQYITADDRVRKQTVDGLAALLTYALQECAANKKDSADTEVNMVCCLFGRTTNGLLDNSCPAVRLHRTLAAKKVYVDLVARTESIYTRHGGERRTISLLDLKFVAPSSSPSDRGLLLHRKTQFSKIRCTYESGAEVVLLKDYSSEDIPWINSESSQGKRILWADYVINELVKHITPPSGQTQVTDERHKKVYETVNAYDVERQPERLKKRLEDLLKQADFTTHRDTIHWPGLPKTAGLITKLVGSYPD